MQKARRSWNEMEREVEGLMVKEETNCILKGCSRLRDRTHDGYGESCYI
jgi:hypothetical protein